MERNMKMSDKKVQENRMPMTEDTSRQIHEESIFNKSAACKNAENEEQTQCGECQDRNTKIRTDVLSDHQIDQSTNCNIPLSWSNTQDPLKYLSDRHSIEVKVSSQVQQIHEILEGKGNLMKICQTAHDVFEELWKMFQHLKLKKELTKLVIDTCVGGNFVEVLKKCLSLIDTEQSTGWSIDAESWKSVKNMMSISWISSDSSEKFCEQVLCFGIFEILFKQQSAVIRDTKDQTPSTVFVMKFILGLVHNCLRNIPDCRQMVQKTFSVQHLQNIMATFSSFPMVHAKSLIVMSYLIDETENDIIMADNSVLDFLLEVLKNAFGSCGHMSRKFGMHVEEILQGLNNLSLNDNNKCKLVKLGCLPIYIEIIEHGLSIIQGGSQTESVVENNEREVLLVVTGLWKLSFHASNRPIIKRDQECMKVLHQLEYFSNKDICHAARGALWELQQPDGLKIDTTLESISPHVMISYQWSSQSTMIKVKDKLKSAGYKVWMDVEHMTGSTLEAMSLAVEGAVVVLICMSEKYKNSPSCRSEAEYTYKLRKSFIPLRMEPDYNPDGWLGMLVGTRLYFDFSENGIFDLAMDRLIKELGDRGKVGVKSEETDGASGGTPGYVTKITQQPQIKCENWTTDKVSDWLLANNVTTNAKWHFLDGRLLAELREIQLKAPEYFFTVLKTDLCLDFVNILKFSKALRHL